MKKFLSMLLVLTMVVTTLMGTMVIDVNAMKVTGNGGEDINTRTWNLDMDISGSQRTTMATGKWTVEPRLAAEGETVPYDLGEITQVSNLGKTYWHMDFDVAYKEADDTNATTAAYARFRTDSTNPSAGATTSEGCQTEIKLTTAQLNGAVGGTTAEDSTITRGGVIRYTFYAYSQVKDTTAFTVQFANPSSSLGSINIKSADLYSENGIPHKVDVYIWSNSADQTVMGAKAAGSGNEGLYFNVVVDGVKSIGNTSCAESATNLYNGTGFMVQPFLNFAPVGNTKSGATYKFTSDWYASNDGAEYEFLTRENLDDESFVNITLKDTYTSAFKDGAAITVANKEDNITGVVASVDEALEAAVVKTWSSTTSASDRVATIFEARYNNPESIFTGEATNVKLVDKTTGAEVAPADATGTMDDYMFMVNGVYVKAASKPDYVEAVGKVYYPKAHNVVTTRARHEDYVNNTAEVPFGGMTNGFYKFTNEPRSGFTFDKSAIMYNQAGYVGLNVYAGTNTGAVGDASSKLTKYAVEKNMVTAEFDLYIPEYTATASSNYRLTFSMFDGGFASGNRKNNPTLFFTTGGLGSVGVQDKYVIDLEPNSWSTVSIQIDMTEAAADGKIDYRIYVNGELRTSYESTEGDYKDEALTNFAPIAFMRFYSPSYLSYAMRGTGKWYMGGYTPSATPISTGTITESDDKITVDEESLLISSTYATDEELIAAMAGYIPVYTSIVDVNAVNTAYNREDGAAPTAVTVAGAAKAWKGKLIKKYVENSGWFTVTEGVDGAPNTYAVATSAPAGANASELAKILSATDNGDGTATIAFSTETFGDANVYEDVATQLPDIIAADPSTRVDTLVGFAVVEEGKLPKVYTLAENGMELRSLTYNKETAQAELTYREYGGTAEDSYTFQLVVAAYNKDGKLLSLKIDTSKTITGEGPDGTNVVTFAPGFAEDVLAETYFYKVFAFETFVSGKAVVSSAKVLK